MENEEKKYQDVIEALKGLKKVKAPANFEADLKRRINSEKFSKEEKRGFRENIFVPARLIPSLGLIAAAVVIFFIVETNPEEMDNPFLIEPRVREDIIAVTDYEGLINQQKELSKQKSLKKNEPTVQPRNDRSELKSSGDKMITGREKSGEVEELSNEKDFTRDKNIAEGEISVPESTFANVTESPQPTVSIETSSEMATGQAITKEELNFRQIQLTNEEQKVVNDLKMQVQSLEKADKYQK